MRAWSERDLVYWWGMSRNISGAFALACERLSGAHTHRAEYWAECHIAPLRSHALLCRPSHCCQWSGLSPLELCVAVQSCVYREYRSGLKMQPWGAPVLRTRGDEVLLPILTTWLLPVRKSRIQLQRDLFSPRVWSFAASVAGTVVSNAEL